MCKKQALPGPEGNLINMKEEGPRWESTQKTWFSAQFCKLTMQGFGL
jgi:hypothetical protein